MLTLIAVASAVATIAYFMYDAPLEENTMTVGNASIELVEYQRGADGTTVESFVNDKILIPSTIDTDFSGYAVDYNNFNASTTTHVDWNSIKAGYKSPIWDSSNINDEIDKMVFVRNTGNTDVYVRVCFAFEAGNYVWKSHFDRMVHLNKNETDWTWDWYNNGKVVEMNGTRYYIAWATYNHVLPAQEYTEISLSQIALDVSAINDHARAFGEKYEVMAFAQGIQAHGFTDATAALTTGFGETIPFKNVKEVTFTNLSTAIHHLNGEENGEDITSKVTSVTFGLTKDHADKVKGYDGVMVANLENQADFTAYAYYVPTADGKYDIYVLADDWSIYTPVDSKKLFCNMNALTKVDTANLDVSKTTDMNSMFYNCIALSDLDVSKWDVSEVTDFANFLRCYFDHDADSKTDGLRNDKLTSLDVSNWVTENATDMSYMFSGCKTLSSLDVSNFDTSGVTTMKEMFKDCVGLTELDLGNWNTVNVTNMASMFSNCSSLTSLDLSNFNTASVTTMERLFSNCQKLSSVNISGLNVSSVTNMSYMFYQCYALVELDLNGWNPQSLTDITRMFLDCSALEKIYVSCEWPITQITSTLSVFRGSKKLEGGNGTKFSEYGEQGKNFARIDGGIDGTDTSSLGYFTYKAPPADATT